MHCTFVCFHKFTWLLVAACHRSEKVLYYTVCNAACIITFQGEERALSSKQQGAALLLHKYATLLCTHAGEILPVASSLASNGPRHFVVSSQIIQRELTGVLLPEFLTAMVLLQTCMPSIMDSSRTVPLISGLLDLLDKFNRLAPGVQKEDEEDLAWPGGIGSPTPARRRADGDITFIRPEDLENHNKDGGLWVVIHGKVYDLQDFKDQVSKTALHCIWCVHASFLNAALHAFYARVYNIGAAISLTGSLYTESIATIFVSIHP